MAKNKALEIDGIFASELRDQQGELLSLEGADISDLNAGLGVFNDNHSSGFYNVLGKITYAKKLFDRDDCEDDRQRYFWDKIKAPCLYGRGVLFNDEDHPNAKAAAAILRSIHKSDCPLKLKASVEGGVVSRGILDPSILRQTRVKRVALTFVPANNATLIEPVSLDKSYDAEKDALLIKSVLHLAQEHVPSFREIEKAASTVKIASNIKKLTKGIQELREQEQELKIEKNIVTVRNILASHSEEELEKGLKDAVKAAALGTALASSGLAVDKITQKIATPAIEAVAPKKVKPSHQEYLETVKKEHPFLGAIAHVESSGGKNLKHATVIGGMHDGHTAGGMYGMMPKTAAFLLSKDKTLAEKYPDLHKHSQNLKEGHQEITKRFNEDPEAATDFAVALYKRHKAKTKNDSMLAYSWFNGLRGAWDAFKEGGQESIDKHPYVRKVLNAIPKEQVAMNKALTAGYGGAAAPAFRTGGSVLQDTGLKYVSCPACGKEQVGFRDQTRCRKCNKAFNMTTLAKLYKSE